MERELATGKDFADIVMIAEYTGEILLVGLNYESDSKSENYKKHRCVTE